jgi:hypothetical protein
VVTFAVQIIMSAVLVLAGAAVLVTGWRGLRGTLPRNRFAGVRTPATMRSDQAFALGNRVAAPATLAGAAVSILVGATLPALGAFSTIALVLVIGVIGSVALILVGGVQGHRAALAMREPEPAGGCEGCPGGCCG